MLRYLSSKAAIGFVFYNQTPSATRQWFHLILVMCSTEVYVLVILATLA